ncbi:hypothetical protein K439DRAFT_1640405 [Ramaria rubella]|nr:hypothetical protein K439DRAFT_1640405 [Ramaria rubella]
MSRYILDPANDFKFVKGERSDLLEYKFNRQALNHMSCPTCASALFIEYNLGPVFLISVNARSIRDLDVQKLTLKMRG